MKHRTPAWTPMQKAKANHDPDGIYYRNSRYQVKLRAVRHIDQFGGLVTELSIKRIGREAILDWRDMQLIKNEIFGQEHTMLQVFPPESRLVDSANIYWFYVLPISYRMPFGFEQRCVTGVPSGEGAKQRPFDEPHHIPADLAEQEIKCALAVKKVMEEIR